LIGAGTIINPIVKIVTTVVILGAIYIFFVRPILDTTEEVAKRGTDAFREAQARSSQASDDFDLNFARDRTESFADSLRTGWPAASRELRDCIRDAGQNVAAMERCDEFGETIVHAVQSNRSFALSYANSLDTQGRTADGDRVRKCVEGAGYKVAAMQQCRTLSDRLLFG
jgi:hypothetical protein